MINLLLAIVVIGSAIWVYLDATKNRVGKVSDARGMNMPAGGWAAFTVVFWIVGFPAYIIKRRELIERAKDSPVEVKNKAKGLVVLASVGVVWIGGALFLYSSGTLPGCDAPLVTTLTKQILDDSPAFKAAGIVVQRVTSGGEIAFEAIKEKRTCRAVMESAAGQSSIRYTVEWNNKEKGEIWVQIVK